MSVAGVILPPPDYLRKSVDAVRAAGGVYIADEGKKKNIKMQKLTLITTEWQLFVKP